MTWVTFADPAYFDMWCVRKDGENRFGHSFHLANGDEALGLVSLLNSFAVIAARSDETVQLARPAGQERDQRQNKDA